nr:DUF971 domain-containing protein [uncultured Roseibium sp.]
MTGNAQKTRSPSSANIDAGEEATPREVRISSDGTSLTVTWSDGTQATLFATFLRENSRSAGSSRLRLSGLNVPASRDLTIKTARAIGAYAINITFSDGYDRGIYPWVFLKELAETAAGPEIEQVLTPEDFLKSN